MKKKVKIIAIVITMITIMTQLMAVAQAAATYDYKASHTTQGKNATVIKSAKWTDKEKGEAEITIEVRNNQKQEIEVTEKSIANADVLIVLDRSGTGRDIDGNGYNDNQMLDYYIKKIMKNFVTNDFANNGNRVTMCEFSSSLLIYDEDGWIHKSTDSDEVNNYSIGLNYSLSDKEYKALTGNTENPYGFKGKNWINFINGKDNPCDYLLDNRMGAITNLYKKAGLTHFKMYGANDVDKIDELIKHAKDHGALSNNTNFDLPLMYANLLFRELYGKTAEDQNGRHPYVIIISDGEPYPVNAAGLTEGRNNELRWDGDWIGNRYYGELAKKLRQTYGAKIYFVAVNTEGTSYSLIRSITGDSSASKTNDTTHVYTVKNNRNAAGKAMNKIIDSIHDTMKITEVTSMKPKPFKATLTDIVNTNDFEVVKVEDPNVGSASVKNGKVTWKISGINYGEKCDDGKWPTLKIKVKLKDKNKTGWFNTNSITSTDDACVLKIEDDETIKVVTPWLEKEAVKHKITIKYINDTSGKTMLTEHDEADEGSKWPSRTTIAEEYMITSNFKANGFEKDNFQLVDNVRIEGNGKASVYKTNNMPRTITIDGDKTIEFHYREVATYKVNLWVQQVDENGNKGQPSNVMQIGPTTNIFGNTKSEVKRTFTRPDPTTEDSLKGSSYNGYRVTYNTNNTFMNKDQFNNLTGKNSVDITLKPDGNTSAVIDFGYTLPVYSVKIKYVDTNGNGICINGKKDLNVGTVPNGGSIGVSDSIIPQEDGVYEFVRREDGKVRLDNIGPINGPTTIEVVYCKPITITVKYIDIITDNPINPPGTRTFDVNTSTQLTWEQMDPNLEGTYNFVKRLDNGASKAETDPAGPFENDATVTFYYIKDMSPVVCYPVAKNDRSETYATQTDVMLGGTLSIMIPNSGEHTQLKNLGIYPNTRDWNAEYAEEKYLEFPFEVSYGGVLYPANTRILVAERINNTISEGPFVFTMPEYIEDKEYTINAYVYNVEEGSSTGTTPYNILYDGEVAVNTITVNVVGKIYDFTITNLIGDKMWPTALFDSETAYKAIQTATNTIGALPIGQGTNTQQPAKYNYGIALGSTFFFKVSTLGVNNESIEIVPKFTYFDTNGDKKDVDLYLVENNKYVPISDAGLHIQTQVNNQYKQQRTDWVQEAKLRTSIDGSNYSKQLSKIVDLGTFAKLELKNILRTPNNDYYHNEINGTNKNVAGNWYGEYRLPSSIVVMPRGVKDSTQEIKKGYILVSFKINSKKDVNTSYLKYEDQYVGDEWKVESGHSVTENKEMSIPLPKLIGQSGYVSTKDFKLNDGYYPVAIYDVGNRLKEDVGGTH